MFLIIYNRFHILNEIKIKSFLLIYFFYLFFLRCWSMNLQPSHIVIWVELILSKSVYTMKDYGADQYALKEDFNVRPDWGKTLQLIKSVVLIREWTGNLHSYDGFFCCGCANFASWRPFWIMILFAKYIYFQNSALLQA